MTLKGYLDNIQAKTGKSPADFRALAKKKGLKTRGEIVAWLKADFALGHGHANAIAHVLLSAEEPKISREDKIGAHFTGKKAARRKTYDALMAKVGKFGADVEVAPT